MNSWFFIISENNNHLKVENRSVLPSIMIKKFCEAKFREFRDFFETRRDETEIETRRDEARLTKNEIFRDRDEISANLVSLFSREALVKTVFIFVFSDPKIINTH